MSSTGTTISRSSSLARPASTISQSLFGPTRNFAIRSSGLWVAERPIRWTRGHPCGGWRGEGSGQLGPQRPRRPRQDPPPARMVPDQVIQPLQSQRQMRPPLDCATAWISSTITASVVAKISRARGGEHQVERLRGGDEDFGRRFSHRPPLGLRRVAGPQADRDVGADPAQRRPQVALDVVGERLQRRDVDEPHARAAAPGPGRAGRSPRGSWPASCPTRSGRRSACWRRRRSPPSRRPGRASAPRRRPRTSADRRAERRQRIRLRGRFRVGGQPTDLTPRRAGAACTPQSRGGIGPSPAPSIRRGSRGPPRSAASRGLLAGAPPANLTNASRTAGRRSLGRRGRSRRRSCRRPVCRRPRTSRAA